MPTINISEDFLVEFRKEATTALNAYMSQYLPKGNSNIIEMQPIRAISSLSPDQAYQKALEMIKICYFLEKAEGLTTEPNGGQKRILNHAKVALEHIIADAAKVQVFSLTNPGMSIRTLLDYKFIKSEGTIVGVKVSIKEPRCSVHRLSKDFVGRFFSEESLEKMHEVYNVASNKYEADFRVYHRGAEFMGFLNEEIKREGKSAQLDSLFSDLGSLNKKLTSSSQLSLGDTVVVNRDLTYADTLGQLKETCSAAPSKELNNNNNN